MVRYTAKQAGQFRRVLAMVGAISHSYHYMNLYTAEEAMKAIEEALLDGVKQFNESIE